MADMTPTGNAVPFANKRMMFDDAFQGRGNANLLRLDNVAKAAVDDIATGALGLGALAVNGITLGMSNVQAPGSVIPEYFTSYHEGESGYRMVSGLAGMFLVGGAAMKAARTGSKLHSLAESAGVSPRVMQAVFADRAAIADTEAAIGKAQMAYNRTLGAQYGQVMPDVLADAKLPEIPGLQGVGETFKDANAWVRKQKTVAAVKEGVAAEMAIAGVYNQNEFVFPADAGVWNYMLWAGAGVGMSAGVDRIFANVALRKSAQAAREAGAMEAAASRAGGLGKFTEGQTVQAGGENWQAVSARLFGEQRLDKIIAESGQLSKQTGGMVPAEAIVQSAQIEKQALQTAQLGAFKRMRADASLAPVMRGKHPGVNFQISKSHTALEPDDGQDLLALMRKDTRVNTGLAFLEEPDVSGNFWAARKKLEDAEATHLKASRIAAAKNDPDAERAALDSAAEARRGLDDLDKYRPGVLEQHGGINYNETRYRGMLDRETVGKLPVVNVMDSNGLQLDRVPQTLEGRPVRAVQLTRHGQFAFGGNKITAATPLRELDMTPDEITQSYTLLGKATSGNAATKKFWENFWQSYEANNTHPRDIPFPVLDAIIEGRVKIPDSGSTAIQTLAANLARGDLHTLTFAKKLDYFAGTDVALDGVHAFTNFDFEKILNMRLTDQAGMDNSVFSVMRTWKQNFARPGLSAVDRLYTPTERFADDALAELVNFTKGEVGPELAKFIDMDNFLEDMRGFSNFDAHKKLTGFGGLWHNIKQPTDTEMQLAQLVENRNFTAMQRLREADDPVFNGVFSGIDADPVAIQQASDVASLSGLAPKNNYLTQTTFSYRGERAIYGAHNVRKQISANLDRLLNTRVGPIAEAFKELFRKDMLPERMDIISWKRLSGIGVKLKSPMLKAGLNEIDVSSPGFDMFMRRVGPLKNAPGKNEPWHAFSVTRAVVDREYVPIEFGENSSELLNKIFNVQYEQFRTINLLRENAGVDALNMAYGHMPVEQQGRFIHAYARNEAGDMFYVKAATKAEAERDLADIMATENARNPGSANIYYPISEQQIASYLDAVDQPFLFRMRDMSGIKQTGTAGGRAGEYKLDLGTDEFDRMLVSMRQAYSDLTERATVAAMAPAFSEAQRIQRTMLDQGMVTEGKKQVKRAFTGLDQWQNVLLGRAQLPEAGLARKVHATAEALYNSAVGKLDQVSPTMPMLIDKVFHGGSGDWANANKAQQAAIQKLIDDYQPLAGVLNDASLAKYLRLKSAPDSYKLSRQLQGFNKVATQSMISFANMAHSLLNVMGVIATMPATRAQLRVRSGESAEDWKRRVGPIADYLDHEGMQATISPVKMMMDGLHLALNDKHALQTAKRLGFLDANMLEELHEHSKLKPNSFEDAVDWAMKYLDFINLPINAGIKRATGKAPEYGTLSERSEVFTRAWAHMSALALIRRSGRKGLTEEAMHAFAHQYANLNIADFSPNIRGEAFRGVAGIPFGLFQSYGINVLQRMFGYVENRDVRALLIQQGMQGLMFGTQGMLGFPQLNSMYFNLGDNKANEQGATSVNERIYAGLGSGFQGDLIMTGLPSSLSKLFGASGINFYGSGDMNPRNPFALPPAFSMLQQVGQGVYEGIKTAAQEVGNAANGAGFDQDRLLDVVANYAPSRGYRALADLILGEHVDRRGNLTVEDTRSGVALLSRLMGVRTTNETKLSAAIWQNSQAQSQRVADMSNVRNQFLRRIREGDGQLDQNDLQLMYNKYLIAGGSQGGWDRWLKYTLEMAMDTRGERRLAELVKDGGEVFGTDIPKAIRLGQAGVRMPTE